MQVQLEKKKRTSTSASRSKSKKASNNIKNDQTVQLKPKPFHVFQNQDICAKVKTENSLSVNKSKGSRKNSKSLKRPEKQLYAQKKGSTKESKDQSYLVSAQRKYSVNKINKTEVTHMQSEDIYKKLYTIKKQLNKMRIPSNFSISQMEDYFNQIRNSMTQISLEPLQSIFLKLHSMYITPIQNFLSIIKPYESILKKKQEISHLIQDQIQENQKLYQQLDPEDIEIIQLKQKIKKNAEMIDQMKLKKQIQSNSFSMKKKKILQHSYQPVKFVDMSNQDESIRDKLDQASIKDRADQLQLEKKLVKQYQKPVIFCDQGSMKYERKARTPTIQIEKPESQSFLGGFKDNKQQKERQKLQEEESSSQEEIKEDSSQDRQDNADSQEDDIPAEQDAESQQGSELQVAQNRMGIKSGGVSFSFKLDIPKIDRSNVGFHDEFYSKLDQFSESWRNQALREKRF